MNNGSQNRFSVARRAFVYAQSRHAFSACDDRMGLKAAFVSFSLRIFICLAGAGILATALAAPATPQRPNIVFILLDNIGQEWIGSYGSEEKCTPQMDRLAAQGVRF